MALERSRMTTRMLRRVVAGSLACLLGAVALAGCAPTDPPVATSTPTSIFASEEEALAAATDVFTGYLAAYDAAMAGGGQDLSAVREYVGDEYFVELSEPGTIVKNNWHTDGVSTFEVIGVANYESAAGSETIDLNICRDLSGVRVVDSGDRDVTPPNRESLVPLTASFVLPARNATTNAPLIISKIESWADSDAC